MNPISPKNSLKLKVCGMREENNLSQLIELYPDFIGLIFHEKSSRDVTESLDIRLPDEISLTGVFVEESESFILEKVAKYTLKAIQLHGHESPEFCKKLQDKGLLILKAFNIHEAFDFSTTIPYQGLCTYFLFDAFGKKAGGNGITFNWKLLDSYTGETPFLLSGGIDENMAENLKEVRHPLFKGVDINSKFELKPGLKDIEKIKLFKEQIKS
jgi:phosphoribosylanthranilate isomerase